MNLCYIMVLLKGWRYVTFVSCVIGGIGLSLYPIIIDPMINSAKYKKMREQTWGPINREAMQKTGLSEKND